MSELVAVFNLIRTLNRRKEFRQGEICLVIYPRDGAGELVYSIECDDGTVIKETLIGWDRIDLLYSSVISVFDEFGIPTPSDINNTLRPH